MLSFYHKFCLTKTNSYECHLFLNNDLVTIIIPIIGNNDMKIYGNIAKKTDGSKIAM